jgi:hypothetical protein
VRKSTQHLAKSAFDSKLIHMHHKMTMNETFDVIDGFSQTVPKESNTTKDPLDS